MVDSIHPIITTTMDDNTATTTTTTTPPSSCNTSLSSCPAAPAPNCGTVRVLSFDINLLPPPSSDLDDDPPPPPRGGAPLPSLPQRPQSVGQKVTQREVCSRMTGSHEEGSARKKLQLTKDQSATLEDSFLNHSTLTMSQKYALAKQLNLKTRQVEVWFQNRRARTKLKQTEVDCELLRRCCESLTEDNRRLHRELQELRLLKTLPPPSPRDYFVSYPIGAALSMCPSCHKIAPTTTTTTTSTTATTITAPIPMDFPYPNPTQQKTSGKSYIPS